MKQPAFPPTCAMLLASVISCGRGTSLETGGSAETTPTPTPTPTPGSAFTCPEDDSYYFCDDFEDGTFTDRWDDLISSYGLPSQGTFDILDEGSAGKSLRYTAGTRGDNLEDGELILVKQSEFGSAPADYAVEYRIRPRQNSSTGNKYLYAMVRYRGPLQWYFGGLNVQNSSDSSQVELGYADSSGMARPTQVKHPIELGTAGGVDGTWYTVRIELLGNTLTAYLDGAEQGTWTDSEARYSGSGLVGLYTYNRSFEIDFVRVGDPTVKPVQLDLDYTEATWTSRANGDPLVVNVTAIKNDGSTADSFSVSSSSDSVVSVAVDGNQVTLTPEGEGTADITFTSGSDPGVQRVIKAQIEAAWTNPQTIYGDIADRLTPAPGQTNAYVDTTLSIVFDDAPALGSTGEVRVFKASDDSLVDRIGVSGETDELGYPGQDRVRILRTNQLRVDGKALVVKLHSHVLAYNEEYYVAIDAGVVRGARLNDVDFEGLGESAGWRFTTRANGPDVAATSLIVDDDGDADFRSVQAALDWVMENVAKNDAFTINVKNGVYNELLYLRNKNNLNIVGESRAGTVIEVENYEGINPGSGGSTASGQQPSGGRSLFLVEGADLLTLEALSLRNTHVRTGSGDQAETIYFNSSSGRLIAKDAAFYSEQDTLQTKGYNWFYNSLVVGSTDFIWGYSVAAVFERSEIRSIGDSKVSGNTSSGGYVLQARVQNASDPGYVFLHSTLTNGASPTGVTINDGTTYLARSSGQAERYDNIAFVNCRMDTHVAGAGWAYQGINGQPAPNPSRASAASGWREYGSMDLSGNALSLVGRCGGNGSCYELTAAEAKAKFCNRAQVFSGFNGGAGWDPYPEDTSDDSCD